MKSRLLIACLILATLFSTTVYAAGDDDGQIIENPWATYFEVSNYKTSDNPSTWRYPSKYGKIFAGWYTDETCQAVYTERSGRAYAKFVDANVLTVKFQRKNDGTAIRFISTVDDVNYTSVGFTFRGQYGDREISPTVRTMTKVYKNIEASGSVVSPTVFSPASKFFTIYTIRGLEPGVEMSWDVIPFWYTPDGTKVSGTSKHYPVS